MAKARQQRALAGISLPTLNDILTHCKITQWDVLIVGDGSGLGWDKACGWAGVLIDKAAGARMLGFGAMFPGTVTLGELFPYLHTLLWYTGKDGPGKQRRAELAARHGRNVHIHVVTDSQTIATSGNNPGSRQAHKPLWAAMDVFPQMGYQIFYHHIPREVVDLNFFVDAVSKAARIGLQDTVARAVKQLQKDVPGLPDDVGIYDFCQ